MEERNPCNACPWANKELKPGWTEHVQKLLAAVVGDEVPPVQACHQLQEPSCLPLEDPKSICIGHAMHQLENGDEATKKAIADLMS